MQKINNLTLAAVALVAIAVLVTAIVATVLLTSQAADAAVSVKKV